MRHVPRHIFIKSPPHTPPRHAPAPPVPLLFLHRRHPRQASRLVPDLVLRELSGGDLDRETEDPWSPVSVFALKALHCEGVDERAQDVERLGGLGSVGCEAADEERGVTDGVRGDDARGEEA